MIFSCLYCRSLLAKRAASRFAADNAETQPLASPLANALVAEEMMQQSQRVEVQAPGDDGASLRRSLQSEFSLSKEPQPSQNAIDGVAPVEMNGVAPVEMNGAVPVEMNGVVPVEMNGVAPVEMNGVVPVEMNGAVPVEMNGVAPVEMNGVAPVEMKYPEPEEMEYPDNQLGLQTSPYSPTSPAPAETEEQNGGILLGAANGDADQVMGDAGQVTKVSDPILPEQQACVPDPLPEDAPELKEVGAEPAKHDQPLQHQELEGACQPPCDQQVVQEIASDDEADFVEAMADFGDCGDDDGEEPPGCQEDSPVVAQATWQA